MTQGSYKQFCPIAMASETLCTRWTLVIVRELLAGSTRFNELRRGMPRISPALLAQRLKELEAAGIVARKPIRGEAGAVAYHLTRSGQELRTVIDALGTWGQRWIDTKTSLENLDVSLLMWDMRRNLNPEPMPDRRCVIHFRYSDVPAARRAWWLVVDPESGVDLCSADPGFDVDLYVATDLRTMTAIWMGYESVRAAVAAERLLLTGDRRLAADIHKWLGLSYFAGTRKLAG